MAETKEVRKKRNDYYPELYKACKYIVSHENEFEDFALLRNNSECGKCFEAKDLHHRLLAQYRLLIGEDKHVEGESVNGADIMPSLDTSKMDASVLAKILVVFHHFTNKDNQRIELKKRLIRVDIKKTTCLMEYLLREKKPNSSCGFIEKNKVEENNRYQIMQESYDRIRRVILNMILISGNAADKYAARTTAIKDFFVLNKNSNIMKEICKHNMIFVELKPYFDSWLYVDLNCYAILQFVIYGIIRNDSIPNKIEVMDKINKAIMDLCEQNELSKVMLEGDAEEIMFKFYGFFFIKDKFLQDTNVLKELMKDVEKQKNPEKEYAVCNYTLKENELSWPDLQILFDEGEEQKNIKTFKKNVINSYNGIIEFNRVTGRRLPFDPITLKAVYRQIYKDPKRYNKRQCKTIFNDFIEKEDMDTLDYYFIDEKINMGIFREYGVIEEFYKKNELQDNLYKLVCMILSKLQPDDIIAEFAKVVRCISDIFFEVSKKYPEISKREKLEANQEALNKFNEYNLVLSKYQNKKLENETSKELLEIMKIWFDRYKLYY